LDDENIAGVHFDLERRPVVFARPVDALDPVASDAARRATVDTERRDAPVLASMTAVIGSRKRTRRTPPSPP
jgi:hypothetical protein